MVLLAAAAGLHVAAARSHVDGGRGTVAFFVAVAIGQLVASLAIRRTPTDRRLRLAAAGGTLALVALWLASRTVGVPIGEHAGRPEAVSLLDTVTVAVELAAAAALLGVRAPRARSATALVAVALLVGGAGAAFGPEAPHGHPQNGADFGDLFHPHHATAP